ncbi:hypothetical protein Tco_1218392 [Tanacetum coccineum]
MMLESVENGPLVYPTVEENGQIRKKKYVELTKQEQILDDCDVQATNIRFVTIEEVNLRVIYQAQVCRNESEDFYTQLHDAQTDCRDIRLEIDVVRGQRTAYETELHEGIWTFQSTSLFFYG